MGVIQVALGEQWPVYQVAAHSILDVGGGPVSPLLKTVNLQRGVVIDPGDYPDWTRHRYAHCGIEAIRCRAEDWLFETEQRFDEAWCMNVLQHVVAPERIVLGMRRVARRIRIFEWIDMPPSLGHPHTLHADDLNDWLSDKGTTEKINENGAVGHCYYGQFDGSPE